MLKLEFTSRLRVGQPPFSFLDISNRRNLGTLSQCIADLLSYDFRLNDERDRVHLKRTSKEIAFGEKRDYARAVLIILSH